LVNTSVDGRAVGDGVAVGGTDGVADGGTDGVADGGTDGVLVAGSAVRVGVTAVTVGETGIGLGVMSGMWEPIGVKIGVVVDCGSGIVSVTTGVGELSGVAVSVAAGVSTVGAVGGTDSGGVGVGAAPLLASAGQMIRPSNSSHS
jgi:hypothetical protein